MKGRFETLHTAWQPLQVYVPPAPGPYRLVMVNAAADFAATLQQALAGWGKAIGTAYDPFVVAFATQCDWNRDFSPWPAPALGRAGVPFAGEAERYLTQLCTCALPALAAAYPLRGGEHILAGYSLGGLAALWAGTKCDAFSTLASLSGSLWYDGALAYFQTHPLPRGTRVYLSLGRAEEKTRNARMRAVGDDTRALSAALQQQGYDCTLLWHDGTHFTQIPQRWKTALQTLLAR